MTMRECDPGCFAAACVSTYMEYAEKGLKPGAGRWVYSAVDRSRLTLDVRAAWRGLQAKRYGRSPDVFPFSEEGVVSTWLRLRKGGDKARLNFCQQFGVLYRRVVDAEDSNENE